MLSRDKNSAFFSLVKNSAFFSLVCDDLSVFVLYFQSECIESIISSYVQNIIDNMI